MSGFTRVCVSDASAWAFGETQSTRGVVFRRNGDTEGLLGFLLMIALVLLLLAQFSLVLCVSATLWRHVHQLCASASLREKTNTLIRVYLILCYLVYFVVVEKWHSYWDYCQCNFLCCDKYYTMRVSVSKKQSNAGKESHFSARFYVVTESWNCYVNAIKQLGLCIS